LAYAVAAALLTQGFKVTPANTQYVVIDGGAIFRTVGVRRRLGAALAGA
jgi:hypothetical protein